MFGALLAAGVLLLTFDDPCFDDWLKQVPLFERYGAHATFFPCGHLGTNEVAKMKALAAAGHTVGIHTEHHRDADAAFAEEGYAVFDRDEIAPQLKACAAGGLRISHLAYPNNRHTPMTDAHLASRFTRFRAGVKGMTGYHTNGTSIVTLDRAFFPVADLPKHRVIEGTGIGRYYSTDIDDICLGIRRAAERNEVLALFSHDISEHPGAVGMRTEWLEKILATAKDCGIAVKGFDELGPVEPQKPTEPMRVYLTFDDAIEDHYLIAAPELERRGWRGIFCVVSGQVGKGARKMTWDQVRDLVRRGHVIANHTKAHKDLGSLCKAGKADEACADILEGAAAIERETGVRPKLLCLPGTDGHARVTQMAREAGMVTMLVPRHCFGEWKQDVGEVIDVLRARGTSQADFLVHGVCRSGGGWKPFETREDFVRYLDGIKAAERAGKIVVATDYQTEVLPLVPMPAFVSLTGGASQTKTVEVVRDAALAPEEYRLSVRRDKVVIRSAGAAGELYARQTFAQLKRADGSYPCVEISDAPKFSWRGVHFDDARHFFGKDEVLKLLETMAAFKLNVLHWHLVDDEGWRLPIPGYPQLTQGTRPVENRRNFRDRAATGDYGPFAYTRAELEEIVRRAAALNVRIVPELEIPGHSRALLKACPEFACTPTGGVRKVDNVCCVGKAETIRFFERVLDEVMAIFPGEVIHIGGDECNRRGWAACADCRVRMAKEGVKDTAELQSRVTAHFERYLALKGRRLMGWDEIAEGGLPPGAMVMSWRGAQTGIVAAQHGHDVVMTPTEFCYFDYPQAIANDPEKYPFNWTLFLPLAKVYALDPLKGIPAEFHRHVLGAQCNNWSEMSLDGRELEWKIWPRAAALAEVLWTYPVRRDFAAFAARMETRRAALVAQGVNAAPVRIHDEPGAAAGRLTRTETEKGFRYDYACGDIRATVEAKDGVLSCTTAEGTRVFKEKNVEIDVCDLGRGAVLITGRPEKNDLCGQVLIDGPRVITKERWDWKAEDPKLPDEIRPYEFVWANRTADEFPPIARLEKADGWTVACTDAEARLETATNRALFGHSVVRLHYRGTGAKPSIRLVPAKPIPLPDAFDTVTLWVYGNNIRGRDGYGGKSEEVPSVAVAAEFTGTDGSVVTQSLGTVWHREWHLLHGIGKGGYGLKLSAITIEGGKQSAWKSIDFTSLCAYVDPKRPDVTPPRAKRGVQVFPEQPQGLNTGTGRLPFPNRPETVIPPRADLKGKLAFRFPKDPADWSDLAFRYGDSDWIPLAVGGGLFPRERAAGARIDFRQEGNSLVCEVAHPEPGVEMVRFGAVRFPGKAETFGWPYYTYRCFNKWCNPLLPRELCGDGPCFYRPQIACAEVGGRTLFVGAAMDWTQSAASGPICLGNAADGTVQLNIGTVYLPKTDGVRNGCFERFVWTFAENVEDVFPAIPNPKSPYMKEAGSGSWLSFHAGTDREKDIAYWRAVKKAGLDHVIITDHEVGWRDGNESFTFRTKAAPKKGGDEGQRRYARTLIDELGFRYGPYNNFTDYAPVNGFWSVDNVGRRGNGVFLPAWNRCYSPKATWAVGMCGCLTPEIQRKFDFNTAYCDVHTCVTPWIRTDYDARSPGAGTFAQVFYCYGEIMLLQKAAWKGPVYSEGGIHWLYSGLTDGNYAQDDTYDFMTQPWLVDFDLKRMHPLCCNFGMGAPYMFYGEERNATLRKDDPQAWMDRFTAATLAFGHPGFFICGRNPGNLSLEKESYYPVQAIAAKYTQAEAADIRYADAAGVLHPTSAALANGAAKRSQLKVTYSDGTVVAVNGNLKENFRVEVGGVTYDLPPNGWRAETADKSVVSFNGIEDGKRVKYAKSPEYDYRALR